MLTEFIIVLFASFLLQEPHSDKITGRIAKVTDGDTVTLLTQDNQQIKIRLEGIDAPERTQGYGTKATLCVRRLCEGKTVTVIKTGTDRYKRILGILYVGNLNVNEYLVRQGLAWHYKQFNKSHRLDSLEQLARKEKLNIWSLPNPVPPWEYRKIKKGLF